MCALQASVIAGERFHNIPHKFACAVPASFWHFVIQCTLTAWFAIQISCLSFKRAIHCIWGVSKITLPGNPPIAGQSRSNRGPTNSNRGAMLGIAAVSVSRLAVLSQALAFLHPYLETGSSDGQALTGGTRPIAVQSPVAVQSRNSAVKLWFAAFSPGQQSDLESAVWACADEIIPEVLSDECVCQ